MLVGLDGLIGVVDVEFGVDGGEVEVGGLKGV